jgi:2-methylcitrate dehydratase PrpD
VRITEDPAMSARAPVKRPARVTVTLKDGRSSSHALDSHRGDFNQPFAEAELRDKFRQLAGESLTQEGAAAVERAVEQADDWASIDALFDIMRRHGR